MNQPCDPKQRNTPAGDCARDRTIQSDCCEHDQHDPDIKEGVDVERVNQMIDVKSMTTEIENFQNKREERDAAEHHVRQIAEQGADKKPHLCSVLTHFVLGPRLDPLLERG